jgi:hypothetical protein
VKWKDGLYYSAAIAQPPDDSVKKSRKASQKYFIKFDNGDTDFVTRDHIFTDDQDVAFFSDDEKKEENNVDKEDDEAMPDEVIFFPTL